MGYAAKGPIEEDSFCAEYIRDSLQGLTPDFESMKRIIRASSGKRFFIPENQGFSLESDFHICLGLNKFNFTLRAEKEMDGSDYFFKKIIV